MKKVCLLAILVGISAIAVAQTEVKSKIEKVTVYPSSALVEKSVTVNLKKGENQFVIQGNAFVEDIHFASSSAWFVGSLTSEREYYTESEVLQREMTPAAYTQYQSLKNQSDDLNLKITNAKALRTMLGKQKKALDEMKALKNTAAFDTIVNLKAQFEYQRKELQSINASLAKAEKELAEYSAKKRQADADLVKLIKQQTGGSKTITEDNLIHVTIYANRAQTGAKLGYSYIVRNVGCLYRYDVMLDEVSHRGVFSLKANVVQRTGEHWKNCQLVFSTTDAGDAGVDRELPVYYLNSRTYVQPRRNMVAAKMARNSAVTLSVDEEESVRTDLAVVDNDASIENEVGIIRSAVQQNLTLSREYALQTNQSIASYDDEQTILLQNDTTPVLFARYATPKNEERVHFTALLPDWENLGLLDVDCNVYMNGRFISTSQVETSGTGDTMRFAVGDDPNVLVGRKHSISSPDKSLLSKDVAQTVTVTLTVKNTKNEPIELRMKDQVPISKDADIKVGDINTGGATLEDKTGTLRWVLSLKPLEQHTVTFSYTVRYPKEKSSGIILR